MELTSYKVKGIIYPHGEYRLGEPVDIIDEGGFYRVDGSHIFDKFKLNTVEKNGDRVILRMKDRDVVLIVEKKM